ncbi:unnamed protein product, partial [Rotaria magnacalcarata]
KYDILKTIRILLRRKSIYEL